MSWKHWGLAALLLAGGSSLAAAQESNFGPGDAKETYYWISQNTFLPLFVQYDFVGMKKVADELHVKVRVAGPTGTDLAGFIAAVEEVCAQKPAGVSVVGGWDPSLTEAVNKCIELGVPTVVDDGDLPTSKRISYIGTNWTGIGEAQAKQLMKELPNGGKIAMLSLINADNMREGVKGFSEYLKANGGGKYEIVASEDTGTDSSKAAANAAALLAAHPDLNAFAGFDSESGPGIVQALTEAGKKPGEIKVTAMEQTPAFFKRVKEGYVQGIIVQNRELFIYYAVKTLYDFNHNGLRTLGLSGFKGQTVPKVIDTGVLTVTSDNVGDVLTAMHID